MISMPLAIFLVALDDDLLGLFSHQVTRTPQWSLVRIHGADIFLNEHAPAQNIT
jgi:hypothetical protein